MKITLFMASFLLCLGTVYLSQAQTAQEKAPSREEYFQLIVPVLEEDSARIVLGTEKTSFVVGEEVVLDISLKNIGVKAFGARYGNDDVDYFFDIKVTGHTGKEVAFLPAHERRRSGPETVSWNVQPQESRDGRVWLNNLFDLKAEGKYQVVVSKTFRRDSKAMTISSEPLTFELTSKPTSRPFISQWK